MDPITHAALGAAFSQVFFGKYNKHIPWLVGAVAAMAPDLDIFIYFKNNPFSFELWHRNFTHSLTFIPIGALLVALFFLCIKYFRLHWKITLGVAFVGYATHGLLDALTSFGTLLFWPWSYTRVSWDIISIVDPLVTLPLILGTTASVIHQQQKWVIMGLLFVCGIFILNAFQHQRTMKAVQLFAKKENLALTQIKSMPALARSTHWRAIAKNNKANCLLIADVYVSITGKTSIEPLGFVPLYSDPANSEGLAIFNWFCDTYVVIANNDPLIIADGRYTIGENPLYSLWGIELSPQKKFSKGLKMILLKKLCEIL